MIVATLLSQNLKYYVGALFVVLIGRINSMADILYRLLRHKSQLYDSTMHLSRSFQDGKFCSQRKKPAFHKFWQYYVEELQYATIRAMSKRVEFNAIRDIANEVKRKKDVK